VDERDDRDERAGLSHTVARLSRDVAILEATVSRWAKLVDGNGRGSLSDRQRRIEDWIESKRRLEWILIGAVVTCVGTVIAALLLR
jgi:hypothetical protein